MMKKILFFTCTFLLLLSAGGVTQAQTKADARSAHEEVTIELISGNYDKTGLDIGLKMTFSPGWHTYWRSPGDGGMPTEIDWSVSENIKDLQIQWPIPERSITFETIENFGYSKEVVLPLNINAQDPTKPVKLNAKVKYAVCKEICIFFDDELYLEVSPNTTNAENTLLIEEYINLLPKTNGSNGVLIDSHIVAKNEGEKYGIFEATVTSDSPLKNIDMIVEAGPNIRFPNPEIDFSNDNKKANFTFQYEKAINNISLANTPLTITLANGINSVEKSVTIESIAAVESLYVILLFAFIGGLILNIMPCVLPVLSLKLLSVIQHGGKHYSRVRLSFLSSTAGIIVSFLVLAGLILLLKAGGATIGWGFHFQEPLFLISMVVILTLFSANMWGLFEIKMPQFVSRLVPKSDDHTLLGHFFVGALATLLATPCSAPFLGTAIGFAFTQGTAEIFLTFAFMGIGLAFPYLLVALRPSMVSSLPKPGQWMLHFKTILGILLASTALWLIWVVNGVLGYESAITLLILACIVILSLFFMRNNKSYALLIISAIIGSYYLPLTLATTSNVKLNPAEIWVKFERDKIDGYVISGKTVFVDVTADWCLTCKANKLLVLDRQTILEALSAENVIAMKADWTKPNENIAKYLESYNRHGIPFNIVYGPSAPQGIPLSELLTTNAVLNALKQAK